MVRKLGFVLLFLVGLVALSVAGAWVYAQTQTGRNQLATLIAGQLGEPGRPADVEGLGGQLPFDIRLGALRLRDEDGIWLEVEDAQLTLRPAALLRGTVEVAEVGAGRVALHRLPVEQEPPKPFSLPQIPELPRSLPHVEIRNVHIDVLALGQPVLGEAATFALTGHGGTGSDGAGAGLDLALRRTDRSTAQLDLSIGVDLAAQTLRVDARGEETGGLLATATGHPEAGALRLSLTGDGPLADWKGRLELNAERLAQLQLAIDIAYAERRRLAMDGSLELAQGALSPDLGDLVGSRVELGLKAAETGPRRYALQQLRVDAGAGSLSGQGELDLAADKVAGEVTLAAPDLQPLSTVAAIPLAGSASLHLTAAGAASRPELTLTPEGRRLTAANLALARLGGSMGLSFTEPISSGRVGLRAKGSLSGDGLLVDGREIGDGHIMLALSGTLPAAGEATLEELALKSGLGEIAAQGRFDRDRLAGTGRLHLNVPDVSSAAKAGGAEIAGGRRDRFRFRRIGRRRAEAHRGGSQGWCQ